MVYRRDVAIAGRGNERESGGNILFSASKLVSAAVTM
jgi:hypothetical protein